MIADTQERVKNEALLPTEKELRRRRNVPIQFVRFVRMSTKMFLLGHRSHELRG